MKTFLLLTMALLGGCAMAKPLPTASGKPEVIISAPRAEIMSNLTSLMVGRGYTPKMLTDYMAIFGKPSESALANIFYGSRYDGTPELRVIYSLFEVKDGLRIVAILQIVANPGSAFERIEDMSGSAAAPAIQERLDFLKTMLSRQ